MIEVWGLLVLIFFFLSVAGALSVDSYVKLAKNNGPTLSAV